jgi:hypothetical protein
MTSPASPIAAGQHSDSIALAWLARLFRLSLIDVLFIGLLLWTFVLAPGGWGRLLWDGDTGLHIRIGNFILQHGYVPVTDPFSFTRQGQHWYATEWLTGVLFSFLNAHLGLKAVVFFAGVTIAATLVLVLRTSLAAGANGAIALLVLLVATNASSSHFLARPHVLTWAFLAISAHLVALDTLRPSRRIWFLVPLMALWVNLHGGFAVLLAYLGIITLGAFLEEGLGSPRLIRYGALTAACAVASLVNPFGYKLHLETLSYLHNKTILNTIQEFQAPTFRSESEIYFMILLFAGLAACGSLLARRRYTQALLIFAFAYLGLTSVRHIPLYAIVAVPIIAVELTRPWDAWIAQQSRKSVPAILHDVSLTLRERMAPAGLWSMVGLAGLYFLPAASSWPQDFPSARFPVALAERHSAELAQARLFTTDQWADYLMFKNPAQRVFLDDRALYDSQIISDALTMMDGAPGWRQKLAKYDINAVLCPAGTALGSELAEDQRWKLIDTDHQQLLFRLEKN